MRRSIPFTTILILTLLWVIPKAFSQKLAEPFEFQFENCNHTLQKCITCDWHEDLSALKWQACENYYETMEEWLREYEIIE